MRYVQPSLLYVLAVILSLSACGFQLRGLQGQWPEHIQAIHIAGVPAESDLGRALNLELEIAGASTSETRAGATHQLRVLSHEPGRRVLTVDPRARAAEIILTEAVTFELVDREDHVLLGPVTAQERRVMLDDPDRRTDKSAEERDLRSALIREVAARMVRQLGAAARSDTAP